MQFIVRLFPEITIKSTPVRKRMVRSLETNLQNLLRPIDERIKVQKKWDRIDVFGPADSEVNRDLIENVLACTPGIANFSRVREFPFIDFDDALLRARELWTDILQDRTFVVRVKRSGKHDFKSIDLEQYVGGGLLHNSGAAGVKMKGADLTLRMELRDETLFLVEHTRQGLGGFPLGTQEPVLSLISGGFDSTVASYFTIKRGIKTHFLFFNLGGRAHELGVKEVAHFLWSRFGASHRVRFITIPFETVVAEILTRVDNAYMGVILKRMMLRVAEKVAADQNIHALVTGESIAQVSSQTLPNLAAIDAVTDTLVIRPLITMDKLEIIQVARDIGTEPFAANMPEYCGVISVKPTTSAKLAKVLEQEDGFDMAKLEQAFAQRKNQCISRILEDAERLVDVEVFAIPQPGTVLLDIRHPDETERAPLEVPGAKVQQMPFFKLQNAFSELPDKATYLLYCDKGVMSRMHAELLVEAGHDNVAVYRPGN